MAQYKLALAQLSDFDRCMEILASGRRFQRTQGFVQWEDHFPNGTLIRNDLENGFGYVLKADDVIAAYLYLGFDGDPSYPEIRGAWKYDGDYAVIHRIAIGDEYRGMGLSTVIFQQVAEICRSKDIPLLRIDTHRDNKRMQHVLTKNGFEYCGIVIQNGGDRLAYEKKL